jgi:hypothetical protein
MIAKADMLPLVLEPCPSFRAKWEAFQDEWREQANDLPLYLVLADLAQHLVGMLERGDTAALPAIFGVVERWHAEGDSYVQEAATIGLLEDLQNLNYHKKGTDPEQFRPYLGPESARCWDNLCRFWEQVAEHNR